MSARDPAADRLLQHLAPPSILVDGDLALRATRGPLDAILSTPDPMPDGPLPEALVPGLRAPVEAALAAVRSGAVAHAERVPRSAGSRVSRIASSWMIWL